jgi:Protein of unknown function (DUF3788)
MGIGIFIDRLHQPTMEEITAALGPACARWDSLLQQVGDNYRVKTDFGFYGKNYGWALRLRKGGKALLSLYAQQNGFTAQVVLEEAAVQQALQEKMGENIVKAIQSANPYAEGRWLFIRVESEQDAADVRRLLELKA